MSRVAEMQDLTEEIARSYEERMAGLMSRRVDVDSALQETRQQMAAIHVEQREAATALHQNLAKAAVGLRADTRSTMREIHNARMVGAASQQAELRQCHAELSQRSRHLMEETHQARAKMAADQQESLREDRAELAAEMTGFLGETAAARAAMAAAQREELLEGRAALHAAVSGTLAGFQDTRKSLAHDLAEFGQVWRDFDAIMQARRSVGAPNPTAERAPMSQSHPGAEPPAGPPLGPAEETMPMGAATYEPHGVPSDEAVFDYLADHPDGLRLVAFEEHFGTQRIRLAPILNRLIQENKARKDAEHKLYFAT